MTFDELKEKSLSLPYEPGVYIMKDIKDRVIYVGKAKKLKNRVSQYFQDSVSHSLKTRQMVSKIHHFDYIVAASEFDALVLECSLIKRHQPKYNILLKDDKGYPYIRVNKKDSYPQITLVNRIDDDGADYFGPFGSRGITNNIIETLRTIFKLPHCAKHLFSQSPTSRVCLHFHMNQCDGWCQKTCVDRAYREKMNQVCAILSGQYKSVADALKLQMLEAADKMNFELAASLRDRYNAVENLGKKQLVSSGAFADTDVIGYANNDLKACFTVLHFSSGTLMDKDYMIISSPDDDASTVSSLMKQYYLSRGLAPKVVFLPFDLEDVDLFETLIQKEYGRKCRFKVPQRGDNVKLVALANKNAAEELARVTDREEKLNGTLNLLSSMLRIPNVHRIEAFDISNISGTDIVAGMVVFTDGKPCKSEYKKFKMRDMEGQDDYGCMQQALRRRFSRMIDGDESFLKQPDLLLIDGGASHTAVAKSVLDEFDLDIPVFGMVKDDRHRTRALVSYNGLEIRIDNKQAVFAFIGSIQEETHRYAINFHRSLRSKRLRYSELDEIEGVGPKRKQDLLKQFKSLAGIKAASLTELERILPANAAGAVYEHFHSRGEE